MEYNLIKLKNNIEEIIEIEENYNFKKEDLLKTELLDLKDLIITGSIIKNNLEEIIIELNIKGIMVLPCSITLKPVDYPFNISICENLDKIEEQNAKKIKKSENTIDILPIIWENILMEIPMKVVSEDADISNLKGNGWRVITDNEEERINPELEKLKDLL